LRQKAHVHQTQAPIPRSSTFHDLHKSYGKLEVLKGVDLKAPRGHVVSLIGSSGSGKSTLLRCCNLLEDSQQGEIRFEGEAVRWKGKACTATPPTARR
jgi:polar amino acid transport system ATP-binding protein